jgi:transcriptional regulator with XRE-family HTH domain
LGRVLGALGARESREGREPVSGSGPYADNEKCRDFVANLVQMRGMRGWSQAELAAECFFSSGVIANMECFQRAPSVGHGQAIDKAFGLTGMFEAKARAIQGGASFPDAFVSFPEHEGRADELYVYEHSLIPGLVQTERYARAVLSTLPDKSPDDVERELAGRMARQEVIVREGPQRVRLFALIDEAALSRPVAEPGVMHEQLTRLVEVSQLPNVSLAVVPYAAGAHIGLAGACTIAERAESASIVNLEDLADGRVTNDPVILKRVMLRFRALQGEALPTWVSRDMIVRMAEELWNGTAPNGVRALTALPTAGSA